MTLTISKARQNLFALAEAAARGEHVEFTHKGKKFFLVAEEKPSIFSRLEPLDILPEGTTIEDFELAMKKMNEELVEDWERRNR